MVNEETKGQTQREKQRFEMKLIYFAKGGEREHWVLVYRL